MHILQQYFSCPLGSPHPNGQILGSFLTPLQHLSLGTHEPAIREHLDSTEDQGACTSSQKPGSIFAAGGEARQEQGIWSVICEQDLLYSEVKCSGQYTLAITLTHEYGMKVRSEESKDTNGFILSR